MVRYESLEVTQEMIEGNIAKQFESGQNCKFECEQSANKPFAFILKVANDSENSKEENHAAFKRAKAAIESAKMDTSNEDDVEDDLFITIEEMDSKGNVVKIEKMESQILRTSRLD